MSTPGSLPVRSRIVAAVALVVVLAAMLVARLLARAPGTAYAMAPAASSVPAPGPCDISKLSIPCWSCPSAEKWPLRFVTDLDMLAPLGTGTTNAAEWFAAFAKPNGPRAAEADAAMARRTDRPPIGLVLPPNDPLLAEAGPWCDQSAMHFYPGIFPVQGLETRIPNLLFMLTLARSWLARGADALGFEDAMGDYRRVIRLGRLLRQEDAVLMNDLVGLACIRIGAEAIYDRARKDGKTDLALLVAVVAAEAPPQKYLSAARVTSVEIAPYLRKEAAGGYALDLPAERFKTICEKTTSSPDRRFRIEAALSLRFVARLGPPSMRERVREVLQALASADDPIVAANARWSLDTPVTDADARRLLGQDR